MHTRPSRPARRYRIVFNEAQDRAAQNPEQFPGPKDCLHRTVTLDQVEGHPNLGTNLIAQTPRIPITLPLTDVVNFLLTQPSQVSRLPQRSSCLQLSDTCVAWLLDHRVFVVGNL